MSENRYREYSPAELEKLLGPTAASLIKPITDLIMGSLAQGSNVTINANAGEVQRLQTQLDAANNRVKELELLNRNLTTARDTAVQQRDAARAANTVNSGEHSALIVENDQLKVQLRNLQARVREAEKLASGVEGMRRNPDPRYNKLRKDYTAACNQRDSFKQTIAAQKITIRSLEDKLAAEERVQVPFVIVDGIQWDAKEIVQMRNVSVRRASEIQELTNKLNALCAGTEYVKCGAFHYSESDIRSLLNTIEQLRRNNENLKQSKPTILVKGKYMTVSQVEGLMDRNLRYAAEIDRLNAVHKRVASTLRGTTASVKRERAKRREMEDELKTLRACKQYVDAQGSMISAENRAASYQDQMNQWRDKYVAEADKVKGLEAEVRRLSGPKEVRSQTSTIEVGPQIVELVIKEPANTQVIVSGVKVPAELIPRMGGDLVAMTSERDGLRKIVESNAEQLHNRESIIAAKDAEITQLRNRNSGQAQSMQVMENRIAELTAANAALTEQLSESRQKYQTQGIELRLVRGRLNSLKAKDKEGEPQVTIQGGQTYMTTDIGLLPVDTDGMRRLADAHHALTAKVNALSGYLQDWATN